jgi:FAD/FMN-containing dehydrogenase
MTKTIETLRSRLKGALLQPGEANYKEASTAWNLQAQQRPALVLMAAGVEDIIAAVQFAGATNIGIGVMATGHGVAMPCDGGLLINTSGLRGVQVDPVAQTAKVEAGALWKDVVPAAQAHGLAGLVGSAPHVGVIGYTLGGGFGYLGRKYGLNAASVIAADIVTADGKLVTSGLLFHWSSGSIH